MVQKFQNLARIVICTHRIDVLNFIKNRCLVLEKKFNEFNFSIYKGGRHENDIPTTRQRFSLWPLKTTWQRQLDDIPTTQSGHNVSCRYRVVLGGHNGSVVEVSSECRSCGHNANDNDTTTTRHHCGRGVTSLQALRSKAFRSPAPRMIVTKTIRHRDKSSLGQSVTEFLDNPSLKFFL